MMSSCIHGHDLTTIGRDSSGHCKACRNEWKKAYYRRKPHKRNQQRRFNRYRQAARAARLHLDIVFANQLEAVRSFSHTSRRLSIDSWSLRP